MNQSISPKLDFPGRIELSFEKLISQLRQEASSTIPVRKEYLENLLLAVEQDEAMSTGFAPEQVEAHRALVDLLMCQVFPSALSSNEIKIASAPWMFNPFYSSQRFQNLISENQGTIEEVFSAFDPDQLYVMACTAILSLHYGYDAQGARPYFLKTKNSDSQVSKYYRMAFNVDFMKIIPTDRAKAISKDDYHELIDNYHDISLWKEKFPPDSWVFSGFTIISMLELSLDWHIKQINEDLLLGGKRGLEQVEAHMANLLGIADLQVSFVSLEGNGMLRSTTEASSSIMLGLERNAECERIFCSSILSNVIEKREPLGIPDIVRFSQNSDSRLAKNIIERGLKSYFVAPVVYQGETIGLLELGSAKKGVLNTTSALVLEEILPALAVAGSRYQQEWSNKIEAVIQSKYTSIHPSVKWRFIQEAEALVHAEEYGQGYQLKDPVFESIFPLYGQMDIRGSSIIRQQAIRNDLLTQVKHSESIMQQVTHKSSVAELEAILESSSHIRQVLESQTQSLTEQRVIDFLTLEVHPLLLRIRHSFPELKDEVQAYLKQINNEFHLLYDERKKYDDSVNLLNRVLSIQLDEKQAEAQAIYPHYYERFKTDGLDFNMFVGQSISPGEDFDEPIMHDLRLWQLKAMVEMERAYSRYKKSLAIPMDIASQILAYDESLAIHFRMDEKRFDVAGASQVRYELIKKRIDKARIKGSESRITEVGKIAVVYSSYAMEEEYLKYFHHMQEKGYFQQGSPEYLELEELPGVQGLKALRFSIQYPDSLDAPSKRIEALLNEGQA